MSRPIYQLQIVRAVAATVVVVFHAQGELVHRGFADPFPSLTIGAFGVDLFFVVSGFIMVVASERLFGRPGAALSFMAKRVVRVAPLYWLFTAAFTGIAIGLGHLPGHPRASATHIVASFLFLPALRPDDGAYFPVYSLGWTLNYEMFFYLCFASVLALARGRAVAALSAGLIGLVLVGRLVALPWPLFYWADPIVLEFVFGLWLGLAHRAGWRMPVRAGTALAVAAVVGAWLYVPFINSAADWRGLAWGLPAATLVAWALGIGEPGTSLPARAATRLGDASFSLYLVHSALFIVVFYALSKVMTPQRLPPVAYMALLVGSSVAAALALYRWLEAPMTRRLQAAVARSTAARPARAVTATRGSRPRAGSGRTG
ncbi:acyltransferase family protein [Lichenibacterium dinghuense]|uniref:acyltransferase family protein n=1 Tax=Lichenibacterium dinghuense TaxID=2895977 RepID=UPI001F17BD23|nr:acyltransferase [Lichenibacterium sp. 6Y81]